MTDMTDMPTPITAQLRAALEDAVVALAQLEQMAAARRNGVNDRDHYRMTQECLDELATAVLAASAASPRERLAYTGARFDLGSKSSITPLLTKAAQYLMGVMDSVPDNKLSAYDGSFTHVARGHLAAITGAVLSSIRHYAIEDLATVRETGTEQFLAAAHFLAEAATPVVAVDDRDAACAAGDED